MILNKIDFYNFGTYGGEQTIELESLTQDQPVTLILGLNGVGKTTLLEAIQLALYGKRSHFVYSKALSFDEYLKGKTHYGVSSSNSASVSLTFSTFLLGKKTSYAVKREWNLDRGVINFRTSVKTDGLPDPSLAESWDEFIETVVPRGISGLFFFDGEQIAALADPEESAAILRSAISSLLGLELVDQLSKDLLVLRRRTLREELPEDISSEVGQIEDQLGASYLRIREREFQISSLVNSLANSTRNVSQLEENYKLHGGDFFERREELTNNYLQALNTKNQTLEALRAYAGTSAPILQILPLFESLGKTLRESRNAIIRQELATELETRDKWMLSKLENVLGESSLSEISNLLYRDRSDRMMVEMNSPMRSMNFEDYSVVESTLKLEQQNLTRLLRDNEEAQQKLDLSESSLSAVPEKDAIEKLKNALDSAREKLNESQSTLDEERYLLEVDHRQVEKLEGALDRLLESQAERTLLEEENARIVSYVDKTRETLAKLKSAETQRHLHRISELIQDSLSQLLRKGNLVHEIEIDPDSFKLSLKSKSGREVVPDQLSAGERQLLAVSLLWGLARSSGGALPVIIDTPLGRLDSDHRRLLVDRYFPNASHQVVLLSTDTEISGELFDGLTAYIGRSYVLSFDDQSNSTIANEVPRGQGIA